MQCINGAGDLVLVVEMLLCGLSQPWRATALVADLAVISSRYSARSVTSEDVSAWGTLGAAEGSPADSGSLAYDSRAAMLRDRSDRLNCALEAVKNVAGSCSEPGLHMGFAVAAAACWDRDYA